MNFDTAKLQWTREPAAYSISAEEIEIVTAPHTDLWQRTYYHFRNDNAPVLQMETDEKFFSFTVKTQFRSRHRFDQCGIVSLSNIIRTRLCGRLIRSDCLLFIDGRQPTGFI